MIYHLEAKEFSDFVCSLPGNAILVSSIKEKIKKRSENVDEGCSVYHLHKSYKVDSDLFEFELILKDWLTSRETTEKWFKNGKLHREGDLPAITVNDVLEDVGSRVSNEYFLNGTQYEV
jgi:arginyl-tRNA--protein-N-Asp/Glu arginylyltransferase